MSGNVHYKTLESQHGAAFNLGCIGNRVYTGIGEDEMYFVVLEGI